MGGFASWSYKSIEDSLRNESLKAKALFRDGILTAMIGYAEILPQKEAEIFFLATHPEVRRQGFMKILLKIFSQGLYNRLILEVSSKNQSALRLYEEFDFKKEGVRPKYYPDGSDALLMSLNCLDF